MNTKKLSNLLLGSALIIGLGASTGSFANVAQMSEATQILVMESASLAQMAQTLVPGFAGTAANFAALQQALNSPANAANASQFASMLKQEQANGASVFHRSGKASKNALNRLRVGLMALVAKLGGSAAEQQANAQALAAGLTSPVAKATLGNDAIKCVSEWGPDTAKIAATAYLEIAKAQTVAEADKNATAVVQKTFFQNESSAQVRERLREATNSTECDLTRGMFDGARPARAIQ